MVLKWTYNQYVVTDGRSIQTKHLTVFNIRYVEYYVCSSKIHENEKKFTLSMFNVSLKSFQDSLKIFCDPLNMFNEILNMFSRYVNMFSQVSVDMTY